MGKPKYRKVKQSTQDLKESVTELAYTWQTVLLIPIGDAFFNGSVSDAKMKLRSL